MPGGYVQITFRSRLDLSTLGKTLLGVIHVLVGKLVSSVKDCLRVSMMPPLELISLVVAATSSSKEAIAAFSEIGQ